MWWNYIDDPHLTDITNTTFVRQNWGSGHGYAREGNVLYNSGNVYYMHNPFIASDFRHPATNGRADFTILSGLTFNGIFEDAVGVTNQDYTNWDFENASFKNSAVGSLFLVNGGSGSTQNVYGKFAKVAGTNFIYKYTFGTYGVWNPTLPYIMQQSGHGLKNISGPGSLLADTGNQQSCLASNAGECWPGSSAGDAYASLATTDTTYCDPGNELANYKGYDWCVMNTNPYGSAVNQLGLVTTPPANQVSTSQYGVPFYGKGLSRRLAQNMVGGLRLQGDHPHAVTDGNSVLFESCAADPHLTTHGASNGDKGCQVYLAHLPPQPPVDGIDRTNYENISVTIGAGSGGATHARVKYGYEENEGTRGTTWPAAIHFYCTQYQGTCYSASQNLALNSTQNLAVGVPQRVLFYQVEYLDSSNVVVATGPLTAAAIP